MKVCLFSTSGRSASYKLGKMLLPQMEAADKHEAEGDGMFFFDDNTFLLQNGNLNSERLGQVERERGILLMRCDQCVLEHELAVGEPGAAIPSNTVDGVRVGHFSDLYAALAGNPPDQVITL